MATSNISAPEAVEYVSKNNTDYITLSEIKQAVNNSDDIMTVNVQNRKNGTAEAYHTSFYLIMSILYLLMKIILKYII